MIDPTSRYAQLEVASVELADGTEVSYFRRRFLPEADSLAQLSQTKTVQGDRMDRVATRTLGDPLAFWRIADANSAMDPFDLVDEADRTIKVPVPGP